MNYTPKADDEVYNAEGELGLFVSAAKGGGYIVQPMLEDGDGITEPAGHYVDGVAIWPNVYRQPPQPMLDAKIAEQAGRLAALQREVAEARRLKHEAERDQLAVRQRLKEHEALKYLDDFLNARITHYVTQTDDGIAVLDVEAFNKARNFGYSERVLTLTANVRDHKTALSWSIKTTDTFHSNREIYAFPDEAKARAQAQVLLTGKMQKAIADAQRNGHLYTAEAALKNAKALGMEPLPELLAAIQESQLKAAQDQAAKAQAMAAEAAQKLAALSAA